MDELENDLIDEKLIPNGEEEDDLILAGAAGAAPTESAMKQMVIGESGYSASRGPGALQHNQSQMEVKTWVEWYLIQEDHDYMVEIDINYIADKFNLVKLSEVCGPPGHPIPKKRFKDALRLIISNKVPSEEDL